MIEGHDTVNLNKEQSPLAIQWDQAAVALDDDPMRPVRYRKCFRYFSSLNLNSKVIEIGCGEGSGLFSLKQVGFQKLMGFEVSTERLRRAKIKLGKGFSLILGSPIGDLPIRSGSVDAVVSAATIEHVVNPRAFVEEISRIVRPGGYVVISSDCYMWRIVGLLGLFRSVQPIDKALFPTTLFRYFRESGLKLLHYEGFPWPGHEFRFLRLVAVVFVKCFKKLTWNLLPSSLKLSIRDRVYQRTVLTPLKVDPKEPGLFENWSKKRGPMAFVKLVLSDENVFFLSKLL